jgi:hypothetical protein
MGQILHGSARTTEAVRCAIQHGQASIRALALARGDGRHPRLLHNLGRADLLILDD